MEMWMVYALGAMFFTGMMGFSQKIASEKNNLTTQSFIFYGYCSHIIIGTIMLFTLGKQFILTESILIYGFLITFLVKNLLESRIKSLKYVNSSTYFIIYRIFSSILLLIFGQIIFGEIISLQQYIGILLGFFIFYLLLEKKSKNESNFDLKKGIRFIFIGIILITIIQLISKNFVLSGEDIYSLFIVEGIIGVILILLDNNKKTKVRKVTSNKNILFLLLSGTLFYFSGLLNALAFQKGDIAIVYKIISYSLFIPIILSVIFYKEKITFKKLLAFVLTIASIGLFV